MKLADMHVILKANPRDLMLPVTST